ncbi:MAG: FadR/GntR family transcriptional regulator [Rubrobacteraceae bacterium]|jgi:GntR family transcriptional repressor for pyruvate dehydrogenase complex
MSLTDEAIGKLKEMILSGQVRPGEKLPVEKALAEQLGLSRSSLREAVRALTMLGVLKTRRGDGTYVTSLEPGLLLESTGLALDLLQENTLVELIEVRRLLEPGATALATARISDEDLSRLEDCMERIDKARHIDDLVEADDEFHAVIARAAGNSTLSSLLGSLSGTTVRARHWRGLTDAAVIERTKAGHHSIYRAIQSKDPEQARAATAMHIHETEAWFREIQAAEATAPPPEPETA